MLSSPVASTPFSVADILRLECQQKDSKTLSQWELHRNPVKPRYLRMNQESGWFESSDRAQAVPFRCTWETVLEMGSNPVGEPRKNSSGHDLPTWSQEPNDRSRRGQPEWRHAPRRSGFNQNAATAEVPRAILPGPSAGPGAALQAAAIPDCARA
ncbi:NK2 transcription factor related, locus 6 (Drosophila), isoform CRA_a [Mus musculus]|nr:NK2 transcription factor related, locus 6 (Drosophila), isoform CRA_a [Mus musculus]